MRCLFAVLVLSLPLTAFAQPVANVPLGVTDLIRDSVATVGYQHFGKLPSSLGYGWVGHDGTSGIYFQPEPRYGAPGQVFMHCPWRGGTGVTFADYRIRLPQTERIRMVFEIGMRPSAKGTDGVTYRVLVGVDVFFEQHAPWKEFRPFEVDLSKFAGQDITVRLLVHPGPAKEPRDDWSLWRGVLILAGTDAEIEAGRKRAAVEAVKARAADVVRGEELGAVSILPLTSHETTSICPSTLVPTRTSVREAEDFFIFTCQGDETIQYRVDPAAGLLKGISVSVNGALLEPAPFQGGPRVFLDGREFVMPQTGLREEVLNTDLAAGKLTCTIRYTKLDTGSSADLTAVLWLQDKSLGIELSGQPGRFSGFRAQPIGGTPAVTACEIGSTPIYHPQGVYAATAFDLMQSDASGVSGTGSSYQALTDGSRNALRDICYLTVSSRYEETLPNLSHKPSPYLEDLSHRLVLDVWGGSFAADEQWLKDMAGYGLDSFLIIKHVWQRDGYDRTYPNTMPARAAQGGDEALRSLSLAAQKLGHRFNVHENYYDYYPNAEDYRKEHCALNPDGSLQIGWDRGPIAAHILKPSRLMEYVETFTSEVKRRYDCDSAYHDIMPTWREDYEAGNAGAGIIRYTHEQTVKLCDFDRDIFAGPVVFEAADPRLGGVYDGGCNHGMDHARTPVSVACELLKVHPKMSNHGFGYYERWLSWGYGAGWNTYVMTDRELDKYRAYQIAFGRTGFLGQQIMPHTHGLVREYYLMQAMGRAYTGRLVERIRYQLDGTWVDAGTAARFAEFSRLWVEYQDGQQVYVNLAAEPLDVGGWTLPQFGTLTAGPRSTAATAIRDGQICDYASYDNVTYADARSHVWLPPAAEAPIEPSVASFKDLGGGQFELSVNWKVSRELDRDFIAFWHFKHNNTIGFQRDHSLKTPTSAWKVGDTITDGPIRIAVKDDATAATYDIAVGLYDKQGRVKLVQGVQEMRIGRLVVERDGEKAISVTLEDAGPAHAPGSLPGPYLEGSNTGKRIIDFGEFATNGAVVVQTTDEGLKIIPVPLGEVMTVGVRKPFASISAQKPAAGRTVTPSVREEGGMFWFETASRPTIYVVKR